MIESYYIYSEFETRYAFEHHYESWYLNVQNSIYVQAEASNKDDMIAINYDYVKPIGGPTISIDTSLKSYHPDLPDLLITSISYDQDNRKFKLGVKNTHEKNN